MKIAMMSLSDPWARSHGGTLRARGFLRAFAELGHDVVCVFPSRHAAAPAAAGRSLAVASEPLGTHPLLESARRVKRIVLPMPTTIGARSRALASAVRDERPDVLTVSTLAESAYVDACPGARLWLDMSDLWSEFARREADARPPLARQFARMQQRQIERLEATRVAAAAVVTTAGYTDASILGGHGGSRVTWLPTPLELARVPMPDPVPRRAGFIANFAFGPNIDAWRVLESNWLPALRARGWEVVVAGLESDRLAPVPGVVRLGPVGDVADFYREIAVTLAPIRLGGGMKVKVAESLLAGRPVVASRFAVDGFPPHIQAMTHVVDVDRPDFAGIDLLAADPIDAAALTVFGRPAFRTQIDELLSSVGAAH